MERQSLRVVVATEYPRAQQFLKKAVEDEEGSLIVGRAQDATSALALARDLRPDAAIIDCYLPHAVGVDSSRLSRIGGLDTAQIICEEIPNTQVILVHNVDRESLPGDTSASDDAAIFLREIDGADAPFTLQQLHDDVLPPNSLVFANVEVRRRVALEQKATGISHRSVLLTVLGALGGSSIVLALVFGGGILLALGGTAAVFLGLVKEPTASFWRRMKSRTGKGE